MLQIYIYGFWNKMKSKLNMNNRSSWLRKDTLLEYDS